jgi:AAA domain
MKLRRLTIERFRGVAQKLSLDLDKRGLLLYGSNGTGKSTPVDALDLWSTGDLDSLKRESVGIGASVHVDASTARITVVATGLPQLGREITKVNAGELVPEEASGPYLPPPPIPVLRHDTMTDFVSKTAGDKLKELLALFGLEELSEFRRVLKTSCNAAKDAAKTATANLKSERNALEARSGNTDLVVATEGLRVKAGLVAPIDSLPTLLRYELHQARTRTSNIRPGKVDDLARALGALGEDPAPSYNAAIANEGALRADALAAFLHAGEHVLEDWPDDDCPLCGQGVAIDELKVTVRERARQLVDAQRKLKDARDAQNRHLEVSKRVSVALQGVLSNPPAGGWPDEEDLKAAQKDIDVYCETVAERLKERAPCPEPPKHALGARLEALAKAAQDTGADESASALVQLTELRDQARRVRDARRAADAANHAHEAMEAVLAVADKEIQRAIEKAIANVGGLAGDYYSRLVMGAVYSDVRLVYKQARSGQVEFHLVFDGRHSVSPPQRVMSESQLNALGLALLLARAKLEEQPWRVLVLDDVVNSFDGDHRQGLARLLADEFGDWQLIVTTHDLAFFDVMRRTLPKLPAKRIVAWTPTGGPLLGEGDPRKRLGERLSEGATAQELGGIGRVALEEALQKPLEKLELPIRYDRGARYSPIQLLQALKGGLAKRRWDADSLQLLQRMEGSAYMLNLGVHNRPDSGALSEQDFHLLIQDLEALEKLLECPDCGTPVWLEQRGGANFHCKCGKVAA